MAPPADRATTDEDVKMVQDAQRLFGEGRYDEAALVATAILEQDPYCINALAIRGDCHERIGEYTQALQCYRDILKIEPDSQLDRIRVARLEKIVTSGEIEIGQPNSRRRTALGAAIAAALLLVSSGSALILASQPQGDTPVKASINADRAESQAFVPVPMVPGNSTYAPNEQAPPQDTAYDGLQDYMNSSGIRPLTRPGENQGIASGVLRDVPREYDPAAPKTVDAGDVQPVRPLGNGQRPPGDPDPTVLGGTTGGNTNDRDMIVDVRPSKNGGGGSSVGNVQADDRAVRIDNLIRVAREQQLLGDFAKAADAYEKALALGASPASTNQRLAQCYAKLNKKAEAIKAYERAIAAFEQMDQNDVRVQTQLEACRAELKLLRGN